jgi:hypothetical protein
MIESTQFWKKICLKVKIIEQKQDFIDLINFINLIVNMIKNVYLSFGFYIIEFHALKV